MNKHYKSFSLKIIDYNDEFEGRLDHLYNLSRDMVAFIVNRFKELCKTNPLYKNEFPVRLICKEYLKVNPNTTEGEAKFLKEVCLRILDIYCSLQQRDKGTTSFDPVERLQASTINARTGSETVFVAKTAIFESDYSRIIEIPGLGEVEVLNFAGVAKRWQDNIYKVEVTRKKISDVHFSYHLLIYARPEKAFESYGSNDFKLDPEEFEEVRRSS